MSIYFYTAIYPYSFSDAVMASKKTTWPGALVDYSGWSVCGASRSICLSPKGWLSLVAVVEIDLGEGVSHVSYTVLERSVHILRHYASICPVAEAFTASLWHALRAVPRGAARIDLTSCRTDIRWWGSLLRAALGDPSVFSWSTAAIAGLLRPSVTVESDASGWGGGLIMVGAHTAAYKFAFTGAERAGSAGDADTAYEINLLECAAFVGGLAAAAPFMVGATLDVALDNTSAISWCRKMRTRKYAGGLLLRWLALILLKFNISICLRHLAGVLNVHADRLSRWCSQDARQDYGARHPSTLSNLHTSAIHSLPTSARALIWQALAVQPGTRAFDAAVLRSMATRASVSTS